MSGTSLDGVDAALVEIRGNGSTTKVELLEFISPSFPDGLSDIILKNSLPNKGNVTEICRLNSLLPHIYAGVIKKLLTKARFPHQKVDLIGTHGQTIHHMPAIENYFGHSFGSTLQIGDPAILAKLTGIITVGDFRTGDMAFGGQGAPLIPYFDFLIFSSASKNRALLNIGGISNFTILKKKSRADDIIAFDTGPGNMLSDFIAKKYFGLGYDKNGKIAQSGKPDEIFFNDLLNNDKYINLPPPKSTGREYYNEKYLHLLLKKYNLLEANDILASVAKLTPHSIFRNYELFVKEKIELDELIISGGGAKNKFFIKELKKYFGKNVSINSLNKFGITSDSKEAVCFAVLANETISGNFSNLPSVTGASRKTILGKICLP